MTYGDDKVMTLTIINSFWICLFTTIFTGGAVISFNYILNLKCFSKQMLIASIIIENIVLLMIEILVFPRFITNDSVLDTGKPILWLLFIWFIFSIIFYLCYITSKLADVIILMISQFVMLVVWNSASDLARDTLVDYNTISLFNIWFLAAIIPLIFGIILMHRYNWVRSKDSKELILYDIIKSTILFILTEYSTLRWIGNTKLFSVKIIFIIIAIAFGIIILDKIIYEQIYSVNNYRLKSVVQYISYIVAGLIFIMAYSIKMQVG